MPKILTAFLATVMNVRIIDPQEQALEMTNWEDFIERSGVYVRRQIELFKGREISFDENGLLATFDGPARAIRCASAITQSASRLNLRVKTGLHTGECDVRGAEYGGMAVELAQKIAEESEHRRNSRLAHRQRFSRRFGHRIPGTRHKIL